MVTYPQGITIEEMLKPNGKTRWNVYYQGERVGQFWTKRNADMFVRDELIPHLAEQVGRDQSPKCRCPECLR